MTSYNIFFFSILFFLLGVAIASLQLSLLILISTTLLLALIFSLFKKLSSLILITLLIPAGFFYLIWNNFQYYNHSIVFNENISFKGVVVDEPVKNLKQQTFVIKVRDSFLGRLLIKTDLYPQYHYGDVLSIKGKIDIPPPDYYGRYLKKEGVQGTIRFAQIDVLKRGGGNYFKKILIDVKGGVIYAYHQLLPFNKSSFLAGMTLGEKSGLSKGFLDKLSLSGTRHLTALSGLHLTILIFIVFGALNYFLPKKTASWTTLLLILLFLALTGFKLSASRAVLMAFLVMLAKETNRLYSSRNALALTALVLVIINPYVLVFDVGFQLSFLAVIGIICLSPIIKKVLLLKDKGFLGWKEGLSITIAAQLAVAPILISQFGNFTLTSFISNVLILFTVPVVMVLGYLASIIYYLFLPLAIFISWIISFILSYQILIINIFSKLAISFNPPLNIWVILIYYLLLATIVYIFKRYETL